MSEGSCFDFATGVTFSQAIPAQCFSSPELRLFASFSLLTGSLRTNKMTCSQLVEHCAGIAEVMGPTPVKA